jgi:hypothetical protein
MKNKKKIFSHQYLPRISNITILLLTSADIINRPVQAIPIAIILLSFFCKENINRREVYMFRGGVL